MYFFRKQIKEKVAIRWSSEGEATSQLIKAEDKPAQP
jgi:hypothetical protein